MMNYPSVKAISERLNIHRDLAKLLKSIMDGSIDPKTVGTDALEYVGSCFRDPKEYTVKLYAISELIQACGVEKFNSVYGAAEYCNAGDSYACTVFYFPSDSCFRIGCYADYVKSSED